MAADTLPTPLIIMSIEVLHVYHSDRYPGGRTRNTSSRSLLDRKRMDFFTAKGLVHQESSYFPESHTFHLVIPDEVESYLFKNLGVYPNPVFVIVSNLSHTDMTDIGVIIKGNVKHKTDKKIGETGKTVTYPSLQIQIRAITPIKKGEDAQKDISPYSVKRYSFNLSEGAKLTAPSGEIEMKEKSMEFGYQETTDKSYGLHIIFKEHGEEIHNFQYNPDEISALFDDPTIANPPITPASVSG